MTLKQRFGRWIVPKLPINPELISILRFEGNAWLCGLRNRVSPSYRRSLGHIRNEKNLSLNVGSGGRGIPGWVNTDAVGHPTDQTFSCDIRKGIPLADCSVARIFAEHIIEHINFRFELPGVLLEFRRVLKPGALVRIIVPDGRRFAEAYVSNDQARWASLGIGKLPADIPTSMAMLNHVFHQCGEHHFAYDFETLAWALRQAGFLDVRQCSFGESSDPLLAIDRQEHSNYSLYVEAKKP